MKRWFGKWRQQRRWDSGGYYRDYNYDAYQPNWWQRAVIKKIVVTMALFGIFYSFHDGEHWIAKIMDNGVRYILTKHVDPSEVVERINMSKYSPGNIDLSVFKNFPGTTAKTTESLIVPVDGGRLIGNFGWRPNPDTKEQKYYEGIEWEATLGAPIKAVSAGQVKTVTESNQYGRTVIIQHGGDMETVYGYCSDVLVKNGDFVTQGQIIAKVGKIASSNQAKLYFEMRVKGQAVDPKTKLNIVGP